ncbi:hypothetical protein JCM17823_07230 [Halorubrum gandharaense]
MVSEDADGDSGEEPADLKWVGPATAAVFETGDLSAADVRDKRVSFRMLVDAGVNPGVAAKIRREHSLSWSFEAGDGLDRRSTQVRGLGSEEAAWVAASAGDWESSDDVDADAGAETDTTASGDWTPTGTRSAAGDDAGAGDTPATDAESAWVSASKADDPDSTVADGSGDPVAAEAAWRTRSKPTPLSTLDVVANDPDAAGLLAEAGITSVRSLATADPEHVADVLDIADERVAGWHAAALDAQE